MSVPGPHGWGPRRLATAALALVLAATIASPVSSAPAEDAWHLDEAFGTGGEVVTDFGAGYDEAFDVAVQKDGKILVAGVAHPNNQQNDDGAIVRYNPNGSVDTTFGNNGLVEIANPGVYSELASIAIQPDGRIVVAGTIEDTSDPQGRPETFVKRLTSNGQNDPSFAVAGDFFQRIGNLSQAEGVAIYPSGTPDAGKIVVVGAYSDPQTQSDGIMVLRLLPDGTLDDSFGSGGGAFPDPAPGDDIAWDVAIDQSGRAIVVGQGSPGGTQTRAEVAVLKADGKLDTSVGSSHNGFILDDPANNSIANGVAIDPSGSGRFAVAGQVGGAFAGDDMALWRYEANGADAGRAFADFFQRDDSAQDLVYQPDGKIVLAGYAAETGDGSTTCDIVDFALARYNADMKEDGTFGNDDRFGANSNKLVVGFGFGYDAAFALARQTDGDLVVAGGTNQLPPGQCQSTPLGDIDFGVARLTGPGAPSSELPPTIGLLLDFTLVIKPEKLKVTWTPGSSQTVNTYDLRMQDARWYANKYDGWRTLVTKTGKTSYNVGLTPGTTYCFEARRHSAGKTTAWSKPECVATPVDDKTLTATNGTWYRYVPPHAPAYYNGTGSGTLVDGAELHLDRTWFRQLEVVYTICKRCGKFAVLVDDKRVDVVDTSYTKDIPKQEELVLRRKTPSRHDVTIKVLNAGSRGVYIDGVGVSLAPHGT